MRFQILKTKLMGDYRLNKINKTIAAVAGILKNNKKIPKNTVTWQKQIRKEWSS